MQSKTELGPGPAKQLNVHSVREVSGWKKSQAWNETFDFPTMWLKS